MKTTECRLPSHALLKHLTKIQNTGLCTSQKNLQEDIFTKCELIYKKNLFTWKSPSLRRKLSLFFNAEGQCYQKINNMKEAEENRGNCSTEEKQRTAVTNFS